MEETTVEVKNEKKELRKINLEDFFTTDNEEAGVWFEPIVNGEKSGMEFLVTGAGTDKNSANAERYDKKLKEISEIKDPEELSKKTRELNAKRIAEFVIGLRPAKNCEINFSGKTIEYSKPLVERFFFKAPLIANEIYKFAFSTANFMNRKKD